MERNDQLVDLGQAEAFIEANWPNDPLLRQIAMNLLRKLPRVEAKPAVIGALDSGDLISRKQLLDTILGHFGVDLAYLGSDLQFCQEAVQFAPSVNEAALLYGFRLKDLAVIAELMKSQSIDPGKLNDIAGDIGMLYRIVINHHQYHVKEELGRITAQIHYPAPEFVPGMLEQTRWESNEY